MSETYRTDVRTTEQLARRLPLPQTLAQALAFLLEAGTEQE